MPIGHFHIRSFPYFHTLSIFISPSVIFGVAGIGIVVTVIIAVVSIIHVIGLFFGTLGTF